MAEPPTGRYFAEFLGTFLLVLTIGFNVLNNVGTWAAVSIACVLTVMIYALGKSSGANFNPAVSLALGVAGKLEWSEVGVYMISQFAGGIIGGLGYLVFFKRSFNLEPTAGHNFFQAAVAELIYTAVLCFVVLNVAASKVHAGKNQFYGLAIGFVIVAGAYGAGAISMGCFNPAVAFGLDVSSAFIGFGHCIVYSIFEFLGALIAVGLFFLVRPDEVNGAPGVSYRDDDGSVVYPLYSRLASEFIGTYVLVVTVGLNVVAASPAGAFSIAASLMSMIFALGSVSGAHFNPAVTVAIILSKRGKCDASDGLKYIAAQLVGGVLAAFTFVGMTGGHSIAMKPSGTTYVQVMIAEFVFTTVLAFVVLSVATTKQPLSEFFGLAIGACVTVGGCAIGKISGGSLNPAVSLGVFLTDTIYGAANMNPCLVYMFVEVVGGIAAVALFSATQPSEMRPAPLIK